MGTGAEVKICLKDQTRRCFCPWDGDWGGIGKQLQVFLRRLTKKQWETLEKKLREEVKWVEEEDEEDKDVRGYRSEYRRDWGPYSPFIKEALAKTGHNPGYALNMILNEKLSHMVHVDYTSQKNNAEAVFDHAEYTYAIDFRARALLVLEKRSKSEAKWIEVPLVSEEQLTILRGFDLFKNVEATEQLLKNGPRC